MRRSAKNIEAQGLAGKILRNKELAAGFRPVAAANSMTVVARIFPILRFAFSSVKVVRHSRRILSVEKMRANLSG
jgi:hypothetical protein